MSAYVDTSVLLARYLGESTSRRASALLATEPVAVSTRLASVEVRRNLVRRPSVVERATGLMLFQDDWARMQIVEMDEKLCEVAITVAEATGLRTLDCLHVAGGVHAGCDRFITFDARQADAARVFGMTVVGVDS